MKDTVANDRPPEMDDEIDLGHLARTIWRGRGVIVATVLASVLVVSAYTIFEQYRQTWVRFVQSFVSLSGIVDQQYPNGASFSPSDLVSEEVLFEVITSLDLQGVSAEALRRAVTVQFGHPDTNQIRREWEATVQAAVDQDASAAELTEINVRYSDRLARLNTTSVSIQFNFKLLNLDDGAAIIIAEAVPAAWQKVFVEVYGFTAPPELIPVSGLSPPRDLSNTRSLLEAQQFLVAVKQIAIVASDDPRLSSLRATGGINTAELQFQIERFYSFYLNPLLSDSVQSDDTFAAVRLQQLRRERSRISSLQEATNASIDQLTSLRGRGASDSGLMPNGGERNSTMLSLDNGGLASVIDLAQQAQLNQYVVLLFERTWELTEQLAEVDFQIAQLTSGSYAGLDVTDEAEVAFANLSQQIEALFSRLMDEEIQGTGVLYATQVPPQVYSNWEQTSQRFSLLFALAIVLGVMLGSATVLVRGSIVRSTQ
jgi:hypothetical protein